MIEPAPTPPRFSWPFTAAARSSRVRPLLRMTATRLAGALPDQVIYLDYPISQTPRYGWGKPPHRGLAALLDHRRAAFEVELEASTQFAENVVAIAKSDSRGARDDAILSGHWLPGDDVLALYSRVARANAALYLEVGSGTSTLVARRAIDDYMLRTKIVSIDPAPRRTVDAACDEVLRTPFETADLSVFNQLSSGDIVFIDNSHRALMNSDVTVFFLEVLPNLPSGVLVHLHDIFLPYDYPPVMSRRAYAEQYLLATAMLCGQTLFEVMHPGQYVIRDPELSQTTHSVWSRPELAAVQLDGGSFWLRIL